MRDAVLPEVWKERIWAERCGEPCPDRYPVRCRRDLNHPDGHIGLDWKLKDGAQLDNSLGFSRYKIEDFDEFYIYWPGTGNAVSGYKTGKCWCKASE